MTHTFGYIVTLLSNVLQLGTHPSDKIATQLKCEYPYESVEYIASMLRENHWHE